MIARVGASTMHAMRQVQDTLLMRLGAMFRILDIDIMREPLPHRWVELIHHLDERERKCSPERQSNPNPSPAKSPR
jgi:hypothetical protein